MRFNAFLCFQQGLTEARSRCPQLTIIPKNAPETRGQHFSLSLVTIPAKGHPVSVPEFPAGAPVPEITHVRVPASAVHPLSPVLAV